MRRQVPIVGVAENMGYVECPCGTRLFPFGQPSAEKLAEQYGTPPGLVSDARSSLLSRCLPPPILSVWCGRSCGWPWSLELRTDMLHYRHVACRARRRGAAALRLSSSAALPHAPLILCYTVRVDAASRPVVVRARQHVLRWMAIQRRRISGRARTRVLLQARASVRWLAETLCAQTLCVCACWVVCDRVLLAGCGACGGVVACCRRPAVLFPIEERVCAGGDGGQPVVLGATSETPVARLFMRLAASVVQQVPLFQSGGDGPRVVLRLSPARVPPPASYSLCAASWLQVCVLLTCRDTPRAV